jgi:hypothetical protein
MKSKKKTKKDYNSQELDIDKLGNTFLIKDDPKKKKEPRKMINRKEVQKEIDIDKKIRAMLATGYYNHNQIASMVRGANLQRVKDNVSRKN